MTNLHPSSPWKRTEIHPGWLAFPEALQLFSGFRVHWMELDFQSAIPRQGIAQPAALTPVQT